MSKLIGSVDDLGRPVVRIKIVGREDEVLGTIDTGFNGEVMVTADDAAKLGITILEDSERVKLGDGKSVVIRLGTVRLKWLDEDRDALVFVSRGPDLSADEPRVLIGTRQLTPHMLLVDFDGRTVEIESHC